ncbi:MAG TPA: nitrile hydratase accessory protein [Roseiarcus sp.]|nr:nitrile hydratase accessory protein [Roseiarcus sp.]
MSPPNPPFSTERPDEPVFAAPWEAQAFALAVLLNQKGVFGWDEWTRTLAEEIHRPETEARRYYEHWLAALERLAAEKELAASAELAARRDAWERATRATPHGRPILLENDPLARRG